MAKLERNSFRDLEAIAKLENNRCRVLVVWECFIRQHPDQFNIGSAISRWIASKQVFGELSAWA